MCMGTIKCKNGSECGIGMDCPEYANERIEQKSSSNGKKPL